MREPEANSTSFGTFLLAVKRHWLTLAGGGLIMVIVLPLFERLSGKNVPTWVYITVLIAFALWACFLAWRDAQRGRAGISDLGTQRREMIAERLGQLIKESPPITPPWLAVHGAGEGLAELGRAQAHRTQVIDFLAVHWPEGVKRFEEKGTRGLEELLAEALQGEARDKNLPVLKGEIQDLMMMGLTGDDDTRACGIWLRAYIFNDSDCETGIKNFRFRVETSTEAFESLYPEEGTFPQIYDDETMRHRALRGEIETKRFPDLVEFMKSGKTIIRGKPLTGYLQFRMKRPDFKDFHFGEHTRLIVIDTFGNDHSLPFKPTALHPKDRLTLPASFKDI